MSLSESAVQFDGFQGHLGSFCSRAPGRHCAVSAGTKQSKGIGEARISQGIVGIVLNGAVKIINSLVQSLLGSLFRTVASLEVELISLGILCAVFSQSDRLTSVQKQTQVQANLA